MEINMIIPGYSHLCSRSTPGMILYWHFEPIFLVREHSEAKYFILTGRGEQLKAYSYFGAKDILTDLNLSLPFTRSDLENLSAE
jgi:hypothetical protein